MTKIQNGMRVLILGAGASHGHGVVGCAQPPLSKGFLKFLLESPLSSDYKALHQYLSVHMGYGDNQLKGIDIEDVFERVEPAWKMACYDLEIKHETIKNKFGEEFIHASPVAFLKSFVVDVIHINTNWCVEQVCPYHARLLKKWIRKGDTIISFNYDLIAESALSVTHKWHKSGGYHITWVTPGKPDYSPSDVEILKLHGSINWHLSNYPKWGPKNVIISTIKDTILGIPPYNYHAPPLVVPRQIKYMHKLLANTPVGDKGFYIEENRFYGKGENERMLPHIFVPTPYKGLDEIRGGNMAFIWYQARKILSKASHILSVGFSFRDTYFIALLREALSMNNRRVTISVADPKHPAEIIERIEKHVNLANVCFEPVKLGICSVTDFIK